MFSMPLLRVTDEEGQPLQAPCQQQQCRHRNHTQRCQHPARHVNTRPGSYHTATACVRERARLLPGWQQPGSELPEVLVATRCGGLTIILSVTVPLSGSNPLYTMSPPSSCTAGRMRVSSSSLIIATTCAQKFKRTACKNANTSGHSRHLRRRKRCRCAGNTRPH
jgi:hypothetical protein